MIGDIMQPTHLLFVLAIALLVLGPKRLPEVGRQLGRGLRDFRAAINGEHTESHDEFGADHNNASAVHQAPAQPVEHEFAHETTQSVADQPSVANGASFETAANGHQFGSEAAEPVVDDHEFAHEAPVHLPAQPADSLATDQPAEKSVDPLT